MRITSETMVMRSLERLQSRLRAYEETQSRLATGKRFLAPSDDPTGARRGLSLRSDIRAREQELRNATDATGWLDLADTQLQAARTRLARIQELATRGASEGGPQERRALAAEIRDIRDEIVGIANTRHLGRPLFGGYTDGPAVERDAGGAWVAHGGEDRITRRVSDREVVRINVTAAEWLGFTGAEEDLPTLLDDLVARLEDGTPGDVAARLDDLHAAVDRVGGGLAAVGAASNRIESARARSQALLLSLRTELSEVEDVDIAEGVTELQTQQVAFEATLQALGRSLPPSLAAFLR